jgi:hypothetical protein
MTDEEHGKAIREMAKALNQAIYNAYVSGIRVEIDINSISSAQEPFPRPCVLPIISRVI